MTEITFITTDGASITAKGTSGSVMELAKAHNVEGIDGDCGGVCSCGTCHVYLDPEEAAKIRAAGEIEKMMLEFADDATEYSRLCCQIDVAEITDGAVLKVAN